MIRPATEIKALTSLRGIAALMVVAQHFSATSQIHAATNIPSLVPHGYVAVDLFFVLSGFIMGYTYAGDFQARGIGAMPGFLLKRVARIVPLNTAAVLAIVLLGVLSGSDMFYRSSHLAFDVLCNLLLVQGLGIGLNLNGPSWSISVECAAYLVFPLFLALALSRIRLVTIIVLLVCAGVLASVALQRPRLGLDVEGGTMALTRCFTEFYFGLVTFRVVRGGRCHGWLRTDGLAIAAAVWALGALALRVDLIAVMSFPLVIATLACNDSAVSRLLSRRPPYFLGEISFSIYLLHAPLRPMWLALGQAAHPAPLNAPLALAFAACGTALVIPVAWAGYVLVERPGRRWVRALAGRLTYQRGG